MDVIELLPWAAVMMISALLFCVLFITFQIGIAVAIAVGPVFIPFLVLPITRFLFEGWLKFLIMAGIYYLAAVVVASLIGVGMLAFAQDTQNLDAAMNGVSSLSTIQHGFVINMGIISQLGVFDLVGLLAMLMVPSFAHAMAGSVNLSGLDMGAKTASMATKGLTKGLSKK
jgi:type IV secretory pathway VirB6-like protein